MAIVTLGKFIKNVLVSLSRLLSPFLATVFLFELGRRVVRLGDKRLGGSNGVSGLESSKKTQAQESWRSRLGEALAPTPFRQGLFLAGGTWCLLALVGYRGMMVHVFEYLFLIPAAALTFARWVTEKGWESWNSSRVNERQTGRGARWWILGAAFVITAVYPFGIYQSSLTHDVINSAILVLTSLGFFATQRLWSPRGVLMALALTGVANFSQTVNYRLEPDAGRAFCLQAREEHARTGQPVRTQEPRTMAKDLYYCAGIPVVYEGENK